MSEKIYIERYWRDAKPEDAIKDPPMVARFRDSIDCNSAISIWSEPMHLVGWDRTDNMNWCNGQCWWKFCQVYDAPDPGDGWRLIDIDKDAKQDGDEYLHPDGTWKKADNAPFNSMRLYRRRITPIVTYVPFTWEDREQLRGRWIKFKNGREVQCTKLEPMNHGGGMVINCYTPLELQGAIFLDTGKPVGKEVTQ